MAATASASSSGPRYAPEDPTLPKPWRGLVDGNTGYLYYWNPETDVTQYERPVANSLPGPPLPPPPPLPPKSTSVPISSSVHIQHSSGSTSQGHHRHNSKEDTGHHNVNSNNGPKLAAIPGPRSHQSSGSSAQGHHHHHSKEDAGHRNVNNNNGPKLAAIPGARSHQGSRGSSSHTQNVPNGSVNAGHGTAKVHDHGSGSQTLRSSSRVHGSEAGGGSSVESYRRQHEITVSGVDVPAPFMTFESTGFPSEILREVHHAGFSAPTPIQAQSWPVALQGRDIVAIAKTGSGKTLGYLIPGFIHIKRCRNSPQIGPTVLVLSPTRELATQIQDEAMKFGRSSRISCTCLYGGAPKGPQLRDLDRGTDVVVATPGRLNDFLEMRRVSLRQVSYLVLDEADRMLDMGFEPQIRKIVNEIPARRQTLMYTATWPKDVRKIAADLLVNPVQVNIGSIDELVANKAITQYVEVLAPLEKQRRLEQLLRSQEPGSKVIVFCTTKRTCDQLSRSITRQFGAAAIHGDKSQGERDWVLNQFRTGKSPILVATDVAARGLDIKDIRVVINYDFPTGIEDYVHRIGRTGRAGATGVAYTFFCDQDAKYAPDLIKVLEGAGQRVPSEVRNMAARGRGGKLRRKWGSGSGGRDGGRSRGAGRDDSSHGGKGGRGPLSSSNRSERGRGGRAQDNHDSRDRFDRDHHDGREVDLRGKHDSGLPTDTNERRDRDRVRGRSHSRSPIRGHGRGLRSRSGSQSRSRNQGRSHSRSRNQGRSRSRSRSRSRDRFGRGHPLHVKSPRLARDVSPAGTKPVDRVRSPLPDQKQWRSPQYHGEDMREADEPAYLQSPQREKLRSPYEDRERVRSPYDGRVESPQHSEEAGEFVAGAAWHRHRSPNTYGEDEDEEEEGLIRGDEEEGLIPADEDGRNSPIE